LNHPEPHGTDADTHRCWAERQAAEYTGTDPLRCPNGEQPLTFVGNFLGNWEKLQYLFDINRSYAILTIICPNMPVFQHSI
jgi:hypothetical protein